MVGRFGEAPAALPATGCGRNQPVCLGWPHLIGIDLGVFSPRRHWPARR